MKQPKAVLLLIYMMSLWPALNHSFVSTPAFWQSARVFGIKLATAAAIFIAFYIGGAISERIVQRTLRHIPPAAADLPRLFGRIAKIVFIVLGLITAFGSVGVNVTGLVAGLGLTGFALGFAFRDILSNILAGVLILLFKPFGRSDHISVAGLEGDVSFVDLRYTVLEGDGKRILIPNSNLFTNPIVVTGHPAQATASTSLGEPKPVAAAH